MTKRFYRQEREFGFIVGGIFVLLGCWWLYRGKLVDIAHWTIPLGTLLLLLGLLLPRALVIPSRAWMLLAEGLSFISTRLILAIVFFLMITPIGVLKRLSGWDPLNRRSRPSDSYWRPYPLRQRDPRHYEKMY
jgi:Saxitoxin biosynthesis operon protein SxtJ